ncbi:papain-like cysteine protease family protein [Pseudomonas sp. FP603]|uniref:papain-like cysteine protease family protein n=1 Tax=Pseudomonas TaxID=286 RepID=UPI00351E8AF8
MRLNGFIGKLLDFQDAPPPAAVLISRPYGVPQSTQPNDLADRYVFLEVPFFHQQHINLCGDASVNMVLAYHGSCTNDLSKNPRDVFTGLSITGIRDQLKEKGLIPISVMLPKRLSVEGKRGWGSEGLCKTLNRHGPIICSGRLSSNVVDHCIVLIGASDTTVVYHDPWCGARRTKTLEQFNAFLEWDDPNAMIFGVRRKNASPGYRCTDGTGSKETLKKTSRFGEILTSHKLNG